MLFDGPFPLNKELNLKSSEFYMKYIGIAFGLTCLTLTMQANAADAQKMDMKPKHTGKTMEQVIQLLGQPEQQWPAVGEPPIVRWQYKDQTVYFEHNKVIHAVMHPKQ